jgi:hypothetical protein
MGILVGPTYNTNEGFVIPWMYLDIQSLRFVTTLSGNTLSAVFVVSAYKSIEDKLAGAIPIRIPNNLSTAETFIHPSEFYLKTPYEIAYEQITLVWEAAGYEVQNVLEPDQPAPYTYIFNSSGYDYNGFNAQGLDKDGYDRNGFNAQGWDRDGYDKDGYNAAGFNRAGYDKNGFNAQGFNSMGYDKDGYDKDGYNMMGLDKDGNPRPPINPVVVPPTQ